MKNGKKPTNAQRKYLDSLGFNSSDWLLVKKQLDFWTLSHRYTGQIKKVYAPTN